MNLLVWTCVLCCLLGHGADGLFIDQLVSFFGGGPPKPTTTQKPRAAQEMEVSLRNVTDSFDKLWKQFMKEVNNLINVDVHVAPKTTSKPTVAPAGNVQPSKPVAEQTTTPKPV
ncbi:hypothetical protein KR093_008013 [Drosophila rubida]|uniref:Secreted protein n=1 Tax=Drosophila rubida TaxID=30044 RepID=A0AAD4KH26_9MUSC|nr:hypothetical protein KR093_008013 [Drosophila rubida]